MIDIPEKSFSIIFNSFNVSPNSYTFYIKHGKLQWETRMRAIGRYKPMGNSEALNMEQKK